jgi:hypothetical protein
MGNPGYVFFGFAPVAHVTRYSASGNSEQQKEEK